MGNENGAMNSGGTSPISEYAPTESGRQRPSQSSTAQHSPTEAPEVDLSHLSEDERSQITTVMARAKHMQEEEIQRVRDLEEDYTAYAANVVRRASLVGAEQKEKKLCPICNSQELKSDNAFPCVDCERFVCSDCGRNDKSLQTGLEEWLCRICDKRRRLVLSTGLWYHGHHVGQDMPKVKGLREGELDEAILRHEFLERAASLPDEAIQELLAREAAAYHHRSLPLSLHEYQRLTFGDPEHMTEAERLLQMELALAERDYAMQMFELDEAASPKDIMEDSPSGRRKSPRPQHLILNHRPQTGDSQIDEEPDQAENENVEKEVVGPPQDTTRSRSVPAKPDIISQQRVAGEGAEAPHTKKKPSALDRVALAEAHEPDRSQSPSRRSPRSPPRSPSWMRFRESPPRSPPMRVLSPTKSPTERFPSTFVERSSPKSRDDTYGEEYTTTDMREFRFDQNAIAGTILEGRLIPDRAPPKPARLSGPYNFDDELEANELLTPSSLDLATYAATVASDTAHLTNMSVSPTNFVRQECDHEYMDHDSTSPSSPQHYYDEADDIDVADPTPKSIDYQGSKRQKVRPPTSDWSPITDLSPILDVSPSIEIIEQEKMLAEQQKHLRDSEQSHLDNYEYSGRPQLSEENRSLEGPKQDKLSPLRRYQAFHDITAIGNGQVIENKENHTSSQQDMIHSIKTAKDISQEVEADRRLQKEVEERLQTSLTNNGIDYNNSCSKQDMSHSKHDNFERIDKEKPAHSSKVSGVADTWKESPVKKIKRSLPEPCAEIESTSRKVPLRGKEPKIMTRELRETKPTSAITGKQTGKEEVVYKVNEIDGKVRPQPLQLKQSKPGIREPHTEYEILKSPVSPGGKIERDYTQSKEVSPRVPSEHKAYMYPSPVTPPDPNTSPPQPRSPSVPRGKHRSSDIPSTMPQNIAGFQTNSAVSKMEKNVPHSPGSPSDKKVRRKLPQVPPGADPALIPKIKQRSRSVDSYSREDNANADKECLRKRLKKKKVPTATLR